MQQQALLISGFSREGEREREKERKQFEAFGEEMFLRRSRFLSFPLVIGAVMAYTRFISVREERAEEKNCGKEIPQGPEPTSVGVISGKALFGQPLDDYWKKKLQEEAAAKETDAKNSTS